jgi:L-iditol 2-dehydrogenase
VRAAVLKGKHDIQLLTEWREPELRPDEVRIRVKACGICGTDQHIYHGHPGSAEVHPPIVLGHELAGEIVEVGSSVSSLRVGDRVSIDPNMYCGNCEYCRNGTPHLCDNLQAVGVTRDGGMGEYCSVPAANCYLLPSDVSDVEGALVEPLGCVLHGFKKLEIRPIHTVMIVGGGFIGQLFLQLVKMKAPAKIVVSEPVSDKHERLLGLGADCVIRPNDPEAVREWLDKADIVIECVGRKESMELSLKLAKKGGQVLLFGVASLETEISVSPFAIFAKELKVMGSFINPYTHEEAIAFIHRKVVRVEELVSHRFSLDQIPDIMGKYPQMNVSKGVIVYQS